MKEVSYFAKPINKKVRFLEAIKLTKSNFGYTHYMEYIIPALLCFDINMDDDLKRYYFTMYKDGSEADGLFPKIRRFFYSVYTDEDLLVDALNKKITHHAFRVSRDSQKMIDDVCLLLSNNMFSNSTKT